MIPTLTITALGAALAAGVYLALARSLWRKPALGDDRLATRSFAVYWGSVGLYQALSAAQHGLAAGGIAPFPLEVALRYLGLALAVVGVAGLLYYVAYLRTGERSWLWRIALAYAGVLALTCYHIWASRPIGVVLTAWSVDLRYERDFQSGLFLPLILALQLVPILAAGWYLTLLRGAPDVERRRRILAVGVGVSVQLLSFMVARIAPAPVWELVSRVVVGVLVVVLVSWAYAPRGQAKWLLAPQAAPRDAQP